jgi:hypothetical protein
MNATPEAQAGRMGHHGTSEANVLVAGLVVALVLILLFLPKAPKSAYDIEYEAMENRLRGIALVALFPIGEDMSRRSCGRWGPSRDECMRSETALRSDAATLWQAADRNSRLRCIDGAERAPGPAGYIYACLKAGPSKE